MAKLTNLSLGAWVKGGKRGITMSSEPEQNLCLQNSCVVHTTPHFIFKATTKAGITISILQVGKPGKPAQDHIVGKRQGMKFSLTRHTISPATLVFSLCVCHRSKPCLAAAVTGSRSQDLEKSHVHYPWPVLPGIHGLHFSSNLLSKTPNS